MSVNANLRCVSESVTPYDSDPTQGWIELQEVVKTFQETASGTRLVAQKRTALVGGPVAELTEMIKAWKSYGISGKLVITEMIHGDLPAAFVANAKNLKAYAKIAGDSKIPCVLGGEQIYRFTKYDPSGEKLDTLVQHDNGDSIRQTLAAMRPATAATL